ncbi:MAG: hypothetical protein ABIZ05_11050 [Pseudonocardiaceae bacterium]
MTGRHCFRRIATLREILGRRARPPAAVPGCTIGFADGPTGIAHCVTGEAFAAGRRTGDLAHPDGTVTAACGIRFRPPEFLRGTTALRGEPPDPDQICLACRRMIQ